MMMIMNKRRIIDQGIIFVCVVIILSGFVLIVVIEPLVLMFLSLAFLLNLISGDIYKSHKDRLPWRKNNKEHHEEPKNH